MHLKKKYKSHTTHDRHHTPTTIMLLLTSKHKRVHLKKWSIKSHVTHDYSESKEESLEIETVKLYTKHKVKKKKKKEEWMQKFILFLIFNLFYYTAII